MSVQRYAPNTVESLIGSLVLAGTNYAQKRLRQEGNEILENPLKKFREYRGEHVSQWKPQYVQSDSRWAASVGYQAPRKTRRHTYKAYNALKKYGYYKKKKTWRK
jgi:hypothetical protein